eukprot:scaffold3282_cov385-Prasinococcus_capsulatus_cf.AAC.3
MPLTYAWSRSESLPRTMRRRPSKSSKHTRPTWQPFSAEDGCPSFRPQTWFRVRTTLEQCSGRLCAAIPLTSGSHDTPPGDIVDIAVGAKVPADLRVIGILSSQLRVDQAILTGESGSVGKDTLVCQHPRAVVQDKTSLLFSGTAVTVGRARAITVAIGNSTEIGRIRQNLVDVEEQMTPLKKKLDDFGTFLSKVIAVVCILVWVVNIGHFSDPAHGGLLKGAVYYFKIAVALAVAAIPEGLPAVVTTCLALGTKKMAKQNAIVRSLPSVETLGCTTVICSDKTGTLTTNMISVRKVSIVETVDSSGTPQLGEFSVSGNSYAPEGEIKALFTGEFQGPGQHVLRPADLPSLMHLSMCSAMCNDSSVQLKDGKYSKIGESTEVALRVVVEKIGIPGFDEMPSALTQLRKEERVQFCNRYWEEQFNKLQTQEFSRDRKMMSVLCSRGEKRYLFVKGAPEVIIARCKSVLCNKDGLSIHLKEEAKGALLSQVEKYGKEQTLRCLAVAFRPLPPGTQTASLSDENDLTFIGIVGMVDPPREEVRQALEVCRNAGIRVIVATGDNKATAESVCEQIGALEASTSVMINSPGDPLTSSGTDSMRGGLARAVSITGSEWEDLPELERERCSKRVKIMSRVEPAHKAQLVDLLKKGGEIVAMTGDGVNDAPALKRADIGIAMGTGTAVARSASDMVLADDNFATIVLAVAEGRAIYNNTKQFIRYMVSSNIGEVVCIFFAAALGMPETLIPVQLLWVNLVTDGLPATALGFNKPDADIMKQSPRRIDDGIVDGWLFFRYLVIGFYVGIVTVSGFAWWFLYYSDGPRISWADLTSFDDCIEGTRSHSCGIFQDRHPSTISMSVLVTVEMFNALNAISENQSLFSLPPWTNLWLVRLDPTSCQALCLLKNWLIRCVGGRYCGLPPPPLHDIVYSSSRPLLCCRPPRFGRVGYGSLAELPSPNPG